MLAASLILTVRTETVILSEGLSFHQLSGNFNRCTSGRYVLHRYYWCALFKFWLINTFLARTSCPLPNFVSVLVNRVRWRRHGASISMTSWVVHGMHSSSTNNAQWIGQLLRLTGICLPIMQLELLKDVSVTADRYVYLWYPDRCGLLTHPYPQPMGVYGGTTL